MRSHQYLLEHPEVIIEAVEILREREQAGKVAGAREQIELQRETLINDPTSPIGGNPDGDVTLVEFFDYHCGYCKRVLGDMLVLLDDDPTCASYTRNSRYSAHSRSPPRASRSPPTARTPSSTWTSTSR